MDFGKGEIAIRANLTEIKGGVVLKIVKTRQSADTIALSDDTLADLQALRQARLAAGTYRLGSVDVIGVTPKSELNPAEFVCLNNHGDVFNPKGFYERLHYFQKVNGMRICSVHDLRHSYGTLLVESAVDVAVVSKAMRHSSIKITSDQYVSSTTSIKRKATEAMGSLVSLGSRKTDGLGADASNRKI